MVSPSIADSVPKVGKVCQKQGQIRVDKGLTYQCKAVRGKLIWSKGKKSKEVVSPITEIGSQNTVTPTPTASPTPTTTKTSFVPWSSKFEAELLIQRALTATADYFGEVRPDSTYELIIDPKITATDREWITRDLDYSYGAFRRFEQERMRVILGTSHEWSRATALSQGLWIGDPASPFPCSQGLNDAYCAHKNAVLLIFSDIYGKGWSWDVGRRSTPAHEVFHVIQFALWGNYGPDDARYIPAWLKEGSANFFGLYVGNRFIPNSYQLGRNQGTRFNSSYRVVVPLKEYQRYDGIRNGIPLDPYGIGQAATEYIIASAGFESLLNIFAFTKSEGSFEKGFLKATGITLTDFYEKFEEARPSMQIGS